MSTILQREVSTFRKLLLIAGAGALGSLFIAFLFVPDVINALAIIWLTLLACNYGIFLGITYSQKILKKAEEGSKP